MGRKNVLKRPFQNVTMFLKSTATLIPYQNATRFHNNTAPRNTKKNVPRSQSKFQLKSRKAFVYGQIRDKVMAMIIAKSRIYILIFLQRLSHLPLVFLVFCHRLHIKICFLNALVV